MLFYNPASEVEILQSVPVFFFHMQNVDMMMFWGLLYISEADWGTVVHACFVVTVKLLFNGFKTYGSMAFIGSF